MIDPANVVGLDTETHLIKAGCCAPRLVCVTISDADGDRIYDRTAGLAQFRRLLLDKTKHIVIHHMPFDACVAAAEDEGFLPLIFRAIDEGRLHCTKIRQMIIENAEGRLKFVFDEEAGEYKKQNFSLYVLAKRWLGLDMESSKTGPDVYRLRYNELDGIPIEEWPPEAVEYAIVDARVHRDVFLAQQTYCEPHGLPGGVQGEIWQTQAAWALYLAGAWGVRTDPQAVAKLRAEVERDYEIVLRVAQQHGFIRKGKKESRDTKKIMEAVQEWYSSRSKPYKFTPGGKVATDREQLTEVECISCGLTFHGCSCEADGVHKGLWAVAEVVRLTKLLSTYIRALERGIHVPLNPNYNPIIETYRTSCSGGMKIDGIPVGVNLQNPPRKNGVRECFVPRHPSSSFAFCDFDTVEMLTLGQTCFELFGYSSILDAARAGEDFHLSLAADMLELEYADADARLKDGDVEITEARQLAKIANYGFAGGMAAATFVSYAKGFGVIVSLKIAKTLHAAFRSKWTEMGDYFRYISSLIGDGNKAEVIEFPKSGLMRGHVNYTAAANGFFQHRAAMGAKDALYQVQRECYLAELNSPLYGCRSWLFAHDEIGIEIPYTGKRASDAALRLQTVMIERMSWWCPNAPISATACMTRKWYKGAKAVFVDGIMVPARPQKNAKGKTEWVQDFGDERMAA